MSAVATEHDLLSLFMQSHTHPVSVIKLHSLFKYTMIL